MRVTGRVAGLSETELYDYPRTGKPEPLVPKFLIAEIEERVDFSGDVVVPLNEEQAREAIEKVLAEGVQALAVCLLWSFRNPSHEKRVRELIAELAPGIPVSLSSEIAPKIGEYERSATVAVNAYTQLARAPSGGCSRGA
jgi:N-methylhydantoinase A